MLRVLLTLRLPQKLATSVLITRGSANFHIALVARIPALTILAFYALSVGGGANPSGELTRVTGFRPAHGWTGSWAIRRSCNRRGSRRTKSWTRRRTVTVISANPWDIVARIGHLTEWALLAVSVIRVPYISGEVLAENRHASACWARSRTWSWKNIRRIRWIRSTETFVSAKPWVVVARIGHQTVWARAVPAFTVSRVPDAAVEFLSEKRPAASRMSVDWGKEC